MAVEEPEAQPAAPPAGDPETASGDPSWKDVYELLRRSSRPGRSAHIDAGAGVVNIREINLGDRDRGFIGVTDVSADTLAKVRAVYTPPSCDQEARAILGERHLVLLAAATGAGRFCAAVHLLGSAGAGDRPIQLVHIPSGDLKELCARDYEPGRREVLLVPAASAAGLSWHAIESLCHRLRELDTRVVVSVDAAVELPPQARQSVVVQWHVDAANELLLRRHVDWYVRDIDAAFEPRELVEQEQVRRLLAARMQPRELDRLAWLVAEVAAGRTSLDAALQRFDREVENEVAGWFAAAPRLDEYALLIALATLHGSATADVLAATRRLQELLTPPGQERDVLSVTTEAPLDRRLEKVRALRDHRTVQTEFGAVEQEILRSANSAWPAAVLRYVWRQHDPIRPMLLRWWRELTRHRSLEVRLCVVSALVDVCRQGFAELVEDMLRPWARDRERGVRWIAAAVLGLSACADDEAGVQARRLLRHWSTLRDQPNLQWTAALGHAYLGTTDPAFALAGLATIATSAEGDLLDVAMRGLAMVYEVHATGDAEAEEDELWDARVRASVLELMLRFSRERPPLGTGALHAFVELAAGEDTDRGWPPLLRHLDATPAARAAALALWARSLGDARTRDDALEALRSWAERSDHDPDMLEALTRLVDGLRDAGGTRERQRLRYYVARWARDGARPSQAAARLLESLEKGD
jgi:hypothetical protein